MAQIQYEGNAYIGVVGPEVEYGTCTESINDIQRRRGDIAPIFWRGTKGYEGRQWHFNKFIESGFSWLFLLDHDMVFPAQGLERLRSHGLPFVSGFYMRRTISPVSPVWFEANPDGLWPARPWLRDMSNLTAPIPIGASGWGCMLMHRDMVLDVRAKVLKGEGDVIEDDMDVWPYHLPTVMAAITRARQIVNGTAPDDGIDIDKCIKVLEQEMRPLRGRHDVVGSDIRYPYLARAAGWQLYGDPLVRCGHVTSYPVAAGDWMRNHDNEITEGFRTKTGEMIGQRETEWREIMAGLGVQL